MVQNRREFLATMSSVAAGVAAATRSLVALGHRARLDKIGIQLYTLRSVASTDLAGTLARLAKIGYKEIEFAGFYGHAATDVRDILKANGLTAPSTHVGVNLIEQTPDKLFEE